MLIDSYSAYALSVLGRSKRTVAEYAKEICAFARWLAPDLDPSESLPLAVRSDVNAYLTHCYVPLDLTSLRSVLFGRVPLGKLAVTCRRRSTARASPQGIWPHCRILSVRFLP